MTTTPIPDLRQVTDLPPVGAAIEITEGVLKGCKAEVACHANVRFENSDESQPPAVMFRVDAEMVRILQRVRGWNTLEVGQWFAMPSTLVRQVTQ